MGRIPGRRLAVSVHGVIVVGMTCVMLGGRCVAVVLGVTGCVPLTVDGLGASVVVVLILDLVLEEVLEVNVLNVFVLEPGPVVLQIVVVLLCLQVTHELLVLLFLSLSLRDPIVMDFFQIGLILVGQCVDSFISSSEYFHNGFISGNVEFSSFGLEIGVGLLLGRHVGVVESFQFLAVSSVDSLLEFFEVIYFFLCWILGGLFFT